MAINTSKLAQTRVLVVGDLMIDEYLWGKVDRISPEAPVQIISVNNENYTLGGAGNVVNNIISLGAKVYPAGVAGAGINGKLLLKKFKEIGADTDGIIIDPGRFTTKKTRIIASNQQVLRIDRETKSEISEKTAKTLLKIIENKIPDVDIVLISDYGKGIITKPFLTRLVEIAKRHDKVTIADPKGLDFTKYSGISLITPNKKEASVVSGIEIVDEPSLHKAGAAILKTAGVDNLLITCGKEGMTLFEKGKKPYKITAQARQVYDVSGAGDTVLAVLGLAAAQGIPFKKGAYLANKAAGIVVGKVGTATVSIKELKAALESDKLGAVLKHKKISELPDLVRDLKKKGKKIVMTNGCFDLLHVGHIILFAASKRMGDVLIAAIDDDESVKKIKGKGRPVIRADERIRILSALDSIDYVVAFPPGNLEKLIAIIQPDILTKGSNYSSQEVYGSKIVEQHGGRVVLIPVTEDISSTGIINNIKNLDI